VVSPALLEDLASALDSRQIDVGFKLLKQNRDQFTDFSPASPNSGVALGRLAEWIDVGFGGESLLDEALGGLSSEVSRTLPVSDYINIRLARAEVAMRREDLTQALEHLDFVLGIGPELNDKRLMAVANFWKARCLRKAGEYDWALEFAQSGRDLAIGAGLTPMASVIRILESWLLFQRGKSKEAVRVLQEAEAVLRETDDFISLGNIQSAYGRIARREGRYEHAMQYFDSAIEIFKRRPSLRGYLARSLTNLAKAKRLLALQLKRRMDAEREQNRSSRRGEYVKEGKAGQLERIRSLLHDALADLKQADEIYRNPLTHHGAGNVQIGFGEIYLDLGHLEEAYEAAQKAFELGSSNADYLLMCRARIAQAMWGNARFEEQIGDGEEPSRFAQFAYDSAHEAVTFAEHTQSRRILARANIWQGLVLVNGFFNNPEMARACADKAEEYLSTDRYGALWEDLKLLRTRILRGSKLDPNLRAWSQGVVGEKSLQQVVEEFEALVISKVWEREGRKVSRVAQRLLVSPKKVRRLLRRLGLLAESEAADATSGK
jgi:tetratricopeptide (TPR) repeat protein